VKRKPGGADWWWIAGDDEGIGILQAAPHEMAAQRHRASGKKAF